MFTVYNRFRAPWFGLSDTWILRVRKRMVFIWTAICSNYLPHCFLSEEFLPPVRNHVLRFSIVYDKDGSISVICSSSDFFSKYLLDVDFVQHQCQNYLPKWKLQRSVFSCRAVKYCLFFINAKCFKTFCEKTSRADLQIVFLTAFRLKTCWAILRKTAQPN